jgi:hypothetical protein
MVRRPEQVTTYSAKIPNETMHRHEPLRLSGRLEPAHLPFALARGLMRQLGAIVLVLRRAVHHRGHHVSVGRGVAAQLVRDHPSWRPALSFQQLPEEAFGRVAIASRLHKDVDHVAIVIDRAEIDNRDSSEAASSSAYSARRSLNLTIPHGHSARLRASSRPLRLRRSSRATSVR